MNLCSSAPCNSNADAFVQGVVEIVCEQIFEPAISLMLDSCRFKEDLPDMEFVINGMLCYLDLG